jgi:hypothetical protein
MAFSSPRSREVAQPRSAADLRDGGDDLSEGVALSACQPPPKILIVVTQVTLALVVAVLTLGKAPERHWHKVRFVTGF